MIAPENVDALEAEASALGHYLVGRPIDEESRRRYAHAVRSGMTPLDGRDERLLRRAVAHPWLLGMIDAAAAIRRPSGSVRRRFLLMFAILETSPEYCDVFVPRKLTWRDGIGLPWACVRGAARAVAGLLMWSLLR